MIDSSGNTIALLDARRLTGRRHFNVMIKPVGSACNMACSYCYYLDKAALYGNREQVMGFDTLEVLIKSYFEADDSDCVEFNWHGGEPLLSGPGFYRKVLELERRYSAGRRVSNTIQTNGLLLSMEWADFFAANGFLVGISIDGPEDLHDGNRRRKGGEPTFRKVMDGISNLLSAGAQFNTMTTVNRLSEGRGKEVYSFLKGIGSRYMQFMPVLEYLDSNEREARIADPFEKSSSLAGWSVSPEGFGRFLCDVFDEWVRRDIGVIFVNQFDSTLANWCGVNPGSCVYGRLCGGNAVVEHNGDVYPCDHFVYPKYRLGNIKERSLEDIVNSPDMADFSLRKQSGLSSGCRGCEYLFACNAECPKHWHCVDGQDNAKSNALCEGYYMFYSHVAPYMDRMRECIRRKESPANIF
ncbi:MAG: anaerobic sulfatase maturase [Bacteroidales bacterium]|nr:anaerobic sulfatase maturase [Candidatus Cacconaster merdequi]